MHLIHVKYILLYIFKSRDITTKVCVVKAMVFPVVITDVRVGL